MSLGAPWVSLGMPLGCFERRVDGCLTKVLHWGAIGLLSVGRGWLPSPGFALGSLRVALDDEGVEQLLHAMLCYAMFNINTPQHRSE